MDDLLGLVPYHARQIKNSGQVQTALNMYPGKVSILRIGDFTECYKYFCNITNEERLRYIYKCVQRGIFFDEI